MTPGSGPDTAPEGAVFAATIDEIVAALEQEPVLVEEMMGNGHTEAIREALTEKVATSPVPAHVVLTGTPSDLTTTGSKTDEALLSVLHGRLDVDGVWLVATPAGFRVETGLYVDLVPDDDYDDTRLSNAVGEALADIEQAIEIDCDHCLSPSSALEAAVTLDVIAAGIPEEWDTNPLTPEQVDSYATTTWWDTNAGTPDYVERAEMPTAGTYAMVATVAALCVTVVGYRLVQAIGGVRHRRLRGKEPAPTPTSAELTTQLIAARTEAAAAHRSLAKALERKHVRADDPAGWERRDVASACLERAETRLDADDLLEVVGALVLARTGSHALQRDHGQYRCCYVDPRHGAATTESRLGGGLQVPVCRRCATDLAKDRPLQPLMSEGRFGSVRPYYERSSVWSRTGFGSLGGDWWREVPR